MLLSSHKTQLLEPGLYWKQLCVAEQCIRLTQRLPQITQIWRLCNKKLRLFGAHKHYLPLLLQGKYVYNSLSLRIQISPFMQNGREEIVRKAQLTYRAT